MYQALLTRRYLTARVMPLLAVLAVMLCTAMVLVVWSVMAGFLNMLLASGRTLMGDVQITWPVVGMPYYMELIEDLEADPSVAAATATIEAQGLLAFENGSQAGVTVVGVNGESYDKVTNYGETLWWKPLDEPLRKDGEGEDPRLEISDRHEAFGLALTEINRETGEPEAAVVPGLWVSGNNRRTRAGWVDPVWGFLPNETVTLSVLPLSQRGVAIDVQARRFPVANEFQSGMHQVDAGLVLVRFDALQKMLRMDRAERVERAAALGGTVVGEDGVERFEEAAVIGVSPARATSVLVKAAEGVTPKELERRARAIYRDFEARVGDEAPSADFIQIYTWEERPSVRTFIAAVKKETGLVLSLFAFISLTAVFLICAIFWAMVSEKTKDIGILRALGAGRTGVAWIYIRYGVVIGVVGSLLGCGVALLVVWNINPIHEWLGEALGLYVWDPSIYYFPEIPSEVEPMKAAVVLVCGIVFSMVGAVLPAVKAARLDPVRALRFE
ncbi:MAG: FtsX-like permease family protein [Planctomycetota bacterium]|nr:FtsX-like permease family protein [Planctomycetota bacterium]